MDIKNNKAETISEEEKVIMIEQVTELLQLQCIPDSLIKEFNLEYGENRFDELVDTL